MTACQAPGSTWNHRKMLVGIGAVAPPPDLARAAAVAGLLDDGRIVS